MLPLGFGCHPTHQHLITCYNQLVGGDVTYNITPNNLESAWRGCHCLCEPLSLTPLRPFGRLSKLFLPVPKLVVSKPHPMLIKTQILSSFVLKSAPLFSLLLVILLSFQYFVSAQSCATSIIKESGWFLSDVSESSCEGTCSTREPYHSQSTQELDHPYTLEIVKSILGVSTFTCNWEIIDLISPSQAFSIGPGFDLNAGTCALASSEEGHISNGPTIALNRTDTKITNLAKICCCSLLGCDSSFDSQFFSKWNVESRTLTLPLLYMPCDGYGLCYYLRST